MKSFIYPCPLLDLLLIDSTVSLNLMPPFGKDCLDLNSSPYQSACIRENACNRRQTVQLYHAFKIVASNYRISKVCLIKYKYIEGC